MQHGTPYFQKQPETGLRAGSDPRTGPASDAFVLSTLFFLWFLIACLVLWAWLIWRRQKNLPPHQRLLMEMEKEAGSAADQEPPEAHPQPPVREDDDSAPWEKPADWWRK